MTKKKKSKKPQSAASGKSQRIVAPLVSRLVHQTHHLYWAYGSNLNVAEMKRRCPQAVQYDKLYLGNGQLIFREVADVRGTHSSVDRVAGGLWWITNECEKSLDRYEGAPRLYAKRYLTLRVDGVVRTCLFYKMTLDGVMPPREEYVDRIARGYHDFNLDLTLLSKAVEHAVSNKKPTPQLVERWRRRGKPKLVRNFIG